MVWSKVRHKITEYLSVLHVEGEELRGVLVSGGIEHQPAMLVERAERDGEVKALQVAPR